MGLEYEILYKKRVENKVADALSRLPEGTTLGENCVINTTQLDWLEEVKDSYINDLEAQKVITGIISKEPAYAQFTYSNGIIRVQNRIYVGDHGSIRDKIMWELHDGPVGGHSGQEATTRRLCQFFYWPAMKTSILEYVKTCDICQRVKTGNQFLGGLL